MIALTTVVDISDKCGRRPTGQRDGVVLVLSAAGFSAAEIANLRVGDLRIHNGNVWVQVRKETSHGWTWRHQAVTVPSMSSYFILQRFVDYLDTQPTDPAAPLLPGMSRKRSVNRVLAKYRRRVA